MTREGQLVFWTALQTIFVGLAGIVALYQLYVSDQDKRTARIERTLKLLDQSNTPEVIKGETRLRFMNIDARIEEYKSNSNDSYRLGVHEQMVENGVAVTTVLASVSNCVQLQFCDEKLALRLFCPMHAEHARLSDDLQKAYSYVVKGAGPHYDLRFGYYSGGDPNRHYFERTCPK